MNNLILVPESKVVISFAVFYAMILLIGYLLSRKKGKVYSTVSVILVIAVALLVHFYTPWVYKVEKCGKVKKGLLLYPQTTNGFPLIYGKHSYILNESTDSLYLSAVHYGEAPEKGKNISNPLIMPQTSEKVDVREIEYFFEDDRQTVKTRQDKYTMYKVECL